MHGDTRSHDLRFVVKGGKMQVTRCDRCGSTDQSIAFSKRTGYDLCESCTVAFDAFMDEKKEERDNKPIKKP
jgi:recombinational DNA repair protein (RecF pathway)